jgi:hypothetical protein
MKKKTKKVKRKKNTIVGIAGEDLKAGDVVLNSEGKFYKAFTISMADSILDGYYDLNYKGKL